MIAAVDIHRTYNMHHIRVETQLLILRMNAI
jgi:hypothetical protein